MNKAQLTEIDERVRMSSPGKWLKNERGHLIIPVTNRLSRHIHFGDTGQAHADIEFIIHAVDDIRSMRFDIDRLDKENARLTNELNIAKQKRSVIKQQTLKEAIELLKGIFLSTPSARDTIKEAIEVLKDFKTKSFEEFVIFVPKVTRVF